MQRRLFDIKDVIKQWDALFKEHIPQSEIMSREIAKYLKVDEESIRSKDHYPAELRSSIIADAIHHRGPLKEFRLDSLFRTKAFAALGYEYQSTYDDGIPLRMLMYQTALRETYPEQLSTPESLRLVVIYSGSDLSEKQLSALHGTMVPVRAEFLFIDLNQLDGNALGDSDLSSLIVRLARQDATDVDLFLAAIRRINRDAESELEKRKLKLALVAASLNKAGLPERLMQEVELDEVVKENLNELAGIRVQVEAKELLELFVRYAQGAPNEALVELVQHTELDAIPELKAQLKKAAASGDWSEFENTRRPGW